jgi:hypothetical protein
MTPKNLHRVFAALAFLAALITYGLTVQPTVPFWDCGEFTAAAVHQQVPHPPGAPLFLMLGKLFHLLPFGNADDSGFRVNWLSVTSSAVTVWLLYLITVMVINAFRKKEVENLSDSLAVYGSAFVGALAFTFSDTFWFNAVESEVYAASSLFVQVMVYLMMRWWEEADNAGHERYLLAIAYLLGLSIGVHLLALLGVFSIVYLVFYRKYAVTRNTFLVATGIAFVFFFIVYKFVLIWMPTMMAGNLPMRNEILEYMVQDETWVRVLAVLVAVAGIVGVVYGIREKKKVLSLLASAFVLMLMGYTTYAHLLLRAQSDSPMNENSPKTFATLLSYIGREQYGQAPLLLPRRYETRDAQKIQNYKKYGKWFEATEVPVTRKDGREITIPKITKLNMSGEINYLLRYQLYHMYLRYFLWNFVGRSSDLQDSDYALFSRAEADIRNFNSGFKEIFPIRFFALPLIFGLIGLFFHFKTDRRMAWVFLVMFLMMGAFAALAQNQQEPQPRERDYFYAGSFMVWCMWIGLGVYALIEYMKEKFSSVGMTGTVVLASIALVPMNMAIGGWKMHSRAGNYLPFDYSYNILQSCEKDAILFTNGDNDTFPVWYLQDVDGVRRDIRVVNLSLGNTLWYVDQLKNQEPWGAKKIPLSFSDESLRVDENSDKALSYELQEAKQVMIPVKPEILAKFTTDPQVIQRGAMEFVFSGGRYGEISGKPMFLNKVQDKLILDILRTTQFDRPIYFSTTAGYPGSETFVGLSEFVRLEGMAYRVCPVPQRSGSTGIAVNEKIMEQCLMSTLPDDVFYREPHYGFKLRNMNDSPVYYDEHHRNYLDSYRRIYMQYANYLLQEKRDTKKAAAVLDKLTSLISPKQFPMSFIDLLNVAEFYAMCGQMEKAKQFAGLCADRTKAILDKPALAEFENGATRPEYDPAMFLCDSYVLMGDATGANEALQSFIQRQGDNPRAQFRKDAMQARLLASKGQVREALNAIRALIQVYVSNPAGGYGLAQEAMKFEADLRIRIGETAAPPVPVM